MYMPFFIQGVMGTSASKSGFVVMFMMLSMVFSSTITGQVVTRTGKYKKIALCGLAIMGLGMYLLSQMTTETTNITAALNLVVVGFGLGMAFPIFNLIIQNAVPHRELGVATASIQLFRQVGGTVGVSVMGTIMSSTMKSELSEGIGKMQKGSLPPQLAEKFKELKDPQILLSPDHLNQIKSQLPPEMSSFFDSFVQFMREAMSSGLSHVFLAGMGVILLAFVLTFFVQEIPLRTSNQDSEAPLSTNTQPQN